jgi:hypothetical protein
VADGGTIIGIGGAVNFLADPTLGLLAIQQENLANANPTPAAGGGGNGGGRGGQNATTTAAASPAAATGRGPGRILATEADFEKSIQPDSELPETLHGAIAKCRVDSEQWVNAGVPPNVYAMVSGRAIFTPIHIDRGINAVTFAGPSEVLASGYMWDEYAKQLAFHRQPQLPRGSRRPEPAVSQRRISRSGPQHRTIKSAIDPRYQGPNAVVLLISFEGSAIIAIERYLTFSGA